MGVYTIKRIIHIVVANYIFIVRTKDRSITFSSVFYFKLLRIKLERLILVLFFVTKGGGGKVPHYSQQTIAILV